MENKKLYFILAGGIVVVVLIIMVLVLRSIGPGNQQVSLEFWGVFDNPTTFEKIFRDYTAINKNVKITYKQFAFDTYEKNLIDALAAGTGPDVLMIHNTWLPKHKNKLKALPATMSGQKKPLFTIQDIKDQFVDVVEKDFVSNGQIYALPLYVDTLALYYNKDLFNTAGISRPPQTWDDFNKDVEILTKLDASANITQAGAAIGTARNINRSTDILMDIMIQTGVPLADGTSSQVELSGNFGGVPAGANALKYYTDFANPSTHVYCWNDSLHYSIDAFSEGLAAMMFNYSHQVPVLKSKSSRLNYAVAPMPQASLGDIKNFANYWGLAVPLGSSNSDEAWKFIAYVASKEGSTSYLNESQRPSARRDLVDIQKDNPDISIFANQSLTAKSWYQVNNNAIETIFAEMIDNVNYKTKTITDALDDAESKINVLMSNTSR